MGRLESRVRRCSTTGSSRVIATTAPWSPLSSHLPSDFGFQIFGKDTGPLISACPYPSVLSGDHERSPEGRGGAEVAMDWPQLGQAAGFRECWEQLRRLIVTRCKTRRVARSPGTDQ
jgi:hypothetical protein